MQLIKELESRIKKLLEDDRKQKETLKKLELANKKLESDRFNNSEAIQMQQRFQNHSKDISAYIAEIDRCIKYLEQQQNSSK